jgi:hypothetical protein
VERARKALEELQAKDGPVQGVVADVKETMDSARIAISGFAENMEALKHNFLVRGFFNDRGFFNLAALSPAEYRAGALTKKGARGPSGPGWARQSCSSRIRRSRTASG